MPLLLLALPAAGLGLWFVNKQVQDTEALVVKGAAIGLVIYVAYINRGAIARSFK
jgi:hypothetical protein